MLISDLKDVSLEEGEFVGGKAAMLGALMRWGFQVPAGFVIRVGAFKSDQLDTELTRAVAKLQTDGPTLFAVRSSATIEDSAAASCAGMHDTYLNVEALRIEEFARQCLDSLLSRTAVAYRMGAGLIDAQMAVIVQRMINAKIGGVMMTCNPMNGDNETVVIEAVPGSCAALVSGELTPDHYDVAKNGSCITSYLACDDQLLSESQLDNLRVLGIDIARHCHRPQEIEWAIDHDGKLHVLQSRPVVI